MARVMRRAIKVFGDRVTALDWLETPNCSLGNVVPMSLLATDRGAEMVMDALGRIEHGVFE